ncbi:hypothetical protein ACOMHN_003684 [Nucella lapillus]
MLSAGGRGGGAHRAVGTGAHRAVGTSGVGTGAHRNVGTSVCSVHPSNDRQLTNDDFKGDESGDQQGVGPSLVLHTVAGPSLGARSGPLSHRLPPGALHRGEGEIDCPHSVEWAGTRGL